MGEQYDLDLVKGEMRTPVLDPVIEREEEAKITTVFKDWFNRARDNVAVQQSQEVVDFFANIELFNEFYFQRV